MADPKEYPVKMAFKTELHESFDHSMGVAVDMESEWAIDKFAVPTCGRKVEVQYWCKSQR